ncbi:efflux RND transporter periplasmic adaptor subunit [Cereibacter sediminicola]|uniref:efflux RND transporter periplasmic adaptor subunit n=1 Tax=Cereibacter sediminicola TaxID=2584941 RepID=UPI0011AA601D|nr:HlyD family efflux transporter periplasmic adaptor subunit [Cereibacter sediminicola]
MARGRILIGLFAAALVVGLVAALRPDPVPVDLAEVTLGPMEVTVEAEGITRVRDPYAVTAPLTGTTARSPVEVGDRVVAGETVVAILQPAEPAFLDIRARRQAEAAVAEAEASVRVAEANLAAARTELSFAEAQEARHRTLADRGIVSHEMLEQSAQRLETARSADLSAQSELELRRATLERMRAQLLGPGNAAAQGGEDCCIEIRAPQGGTVLAVASLWPRLVLAGGPLLTIGDLADLEIEVDLLSSDAVQVRPGMPARIDGWGGSEVLEARVREIEPAAFTRVSALGIEEQRVRLRLDILTPAAQRPGLGDRFRVFVQVVVWSGAEVLQLPQGALFRHGAGWAVFREEAGRAVLTPVAVGRRGTDTVEVLGGIADGARVVLYAGNRLAEAVRIAPRDAP